LFELELKELTNGNVINTENTEIKQKLQKYAKKFAQNLVAKKSSIVRHLSH